MDKLDQIDDEVTLQKMMTATQDLDQRKVIRQRLLAVKAAKSKERQSQLASLEKRREEEIQERKNRKEAESQAVMKRFEDMAKQSTSDRVATFSEKVNQDAIKERFQVAEHEKQRLLEKFDQMAKDHETAKEKNDALEQSLIQQKLEWANEDKARLLEKSKTSTATQLPKTRNIPQGAVSDSKLKH